LKLDYKIEKTKKEIEKLNQQIMLEQEKKIYKQEYETLSRSITQYEDAVVLER
jgi:hypothetical protein